MALDIDLLENVRVGPDMIRAACPVCRENGRDRTGNHLAIFGPHAQDGEGPFYCIARCDSSEIWWAVGRRGGDHKERREPAQPRRKRPARFTLIPPDEEELHQIARLRGWASVDGLRTSVARGLLGVDFVCDGSYCEKAWVISDSSQRNAQARRLDGGLWRGIGGKKAKTIPGIADARWPIGAADIGARRIVCLCEGGPDFCGVLVLAHEEGVPLDEVAPVCMTGADLDISPAALAHFAGKDVVIPFHQDASGVGREAAGRWTRQLYDAGAARVAHFDFSKLTCAKPVKDLADYVALPQRPRALFRELVGARDSLLQIHQPPHYDAQN